MILRLIVACVLVSGVSVFAGQLDLAVIEYQGAVEPEAFAAGFAKVQLSEITDGGKTRTRVSQLQGGSVLFAQSFTTRPGSSFETSTRLGGVRADVRGSFGQGNNVRAEIALLEGIQAPMRNFQKRVYQGSGRLEGTRTTVIGVRQRKITSPTTVKGRARVETNWFTTLVVAQYRP